MSAISAVIPTSRLKQPVKQTHGVDPVTSLVVRDEPAFLRGLRVTNNTDVAGFVQVHNAAAVPSSGAKPLDAWPLPANGMVDAEFDPESPIYGTTGLTIVISSTLSIYTASSNAALVIAYSSI